jgi:hypothetical protein
MKADQPLPPLKNPTAKPPIRQLSAGPTLTLCQPCAEPCANLVPNMAVVFWNKTVPPNPQSNHPEDPVWGGPLGIPGYPWTSLDIMDIEYVHDIPGYQTITRNH